MSHIIFHSEVDGSWLLAPISLLHIKTILRFSHRLSALTSDWLTATWWTLGSKTQAHVGSSSSPFGFHETIHHSNSLVRKGLRRLATKNCHYTSVKPVQELALSYWFFFSWQGSQHHHHLSLSFLSLDTWGFSSMNHCTIKRPASYGILYLRSSKGRRSAWLYPNTHNSAAISYCGSRISPGISWRNLWSSDAPHALARPIAWCVLHRSVWSSVSAQGCQARSNSPSPHMQPPDEILLVRWHSAFRRSTCQAYSGQECRGRNLFWNSVTSKLFHTLKSLLVRQSF